MRRILRITFTILTLLSILPDQSTAQSSLISKISKIIFEKKIPQEITARIIKKDLSVGLHTDCDKYCQ